MVFVNRSALDRARFTSFVDAIPREVFRAKGFVQFDSDPVRYVFHLVGERSTVVPDRKWLDDAPRKTELVFIGRGFDRIELKSALHGCLVRREDTSTVDSCYSEV